ncbi:hypothetical protein [Arcticibacter sp. MXS-1]|uniref:hypothetical protein n=1 Tax=Arcticibacter sp. MXS-1 TaxID=3341726 RepID=UPI0035A8C399
MDNKGRISGFAETYYGVSATFKYDADDHLVEINGATGNKAGSYSKLTYVEGNLTKVEEVSSSGWSTIYTISYSSERVTQPMINAVALNNVIRVPELDFFT